MYPGDLLPQCPDQHVPGGRRVLHLALLLAVRHLEQKRAVMVRVGPVGPCGPKFQVLRFTVIQFRARGGAAGPGGRPTGAQTPYVHASKTWTENPVRRGTKQ